MSWYSKRLAEGLRKYEYYLPELKNAADRERITARLGNEPWHVYTEADLKRKVVHVITRQLKVPYTVAKILGQLGYTVFTIEPPPPKSKKGG